VSYYVDKGECVVCEYMFLRKKKDEYLCNTRMINGRQVQGHWYTIPDNEKPAWRQTAINRGLIDGIKQDGMKILIFSDLHVHNHERFADPTGEGLNTRALAGLKILEQIIELALKGNYEAICFCGDFFHVRGRIITSVFNEAYDWLEALAEVVPVIMIPGNHDLPTNESGVSSAVEKLSKIKNVTVLRGGRRIITDNGFRVYGFASNEELSPIQKDNQQDNGKHGILLLHTMVKNAMLNSVFKNSDGITKARLTNYLTANNLAACFIGDIHLRQSLSKRIHFVGSSIQQSFGEDQVKGVTIYDTVSMDTKFIELRSPQFLTVSSTEALNVADDYNYYQIETKDLREYEQCQGLEGRFKVLPPGENNHKDRDSISLSASVSDALKEYVEQKVEKNKDQKRLLNYAARFFPD
jgi:DNA repair exonuclease SbcCD nuclease subunit